MFPATVSQGNEVYFWNTIPRSFPGACTGFSFTRISPESAWSRPAIKRSRVDLPHPEGPSRTRNSPISRPSREYASSISKLMFSRASTFEPSPRTNDRLTLRTVIFDFLGSIFLSSLFLSSVLGRLQVCGGAGNRRSSTGERGSRFAPGEEAAFEKRQQKAEQEGGDADGDDSRVHAIEIQDFASRLHHVAYALASIQHLGQDHVGPADVIKDAEGRENRGERGAKHEPQHLPLLGSEGVGRFQE